MPVSKSPIFDGVPEAEALFEHVREYIESLGELDVVHHKTQVTFRATTGFAYVWRPQTWKIKRPEPSIILSFDLDHRVEDTKITEAALARPGRWVHHVLIEKTSDLDTSVKAWLREAYAFGQIDRRKRRKASDS